MVVLLPELPIPCLFELTINWQPVYVEYGNSNPYFYTWTLASGSYTPGPEEAMTGNTNLMVEITGAPCAVDLDSFSLVAV